MKKSEFKKLIRRQIRSVLLEAKGMVGTGYEPVPTDNAISQQLPLAPGQKIVLKAEGDDARGLVIQHKKSGGYDVFYWYDDPSKATATEVKIDGKNAKKEAKKIFIGFHKVDK